MQTLGSLASISRTSYVKRYSDPEIDFSVSRNMEKLRMVDASVAKICPRWLFHVAFRFQHVVAPRGEWP